MAKKVPTAAEEAQAKAQKAAGKLKRKDSAVYWALVAQTAVLQEIRDELRKQNSEPGSVTLPEEAPARPKATVSVNEN